MSLIVLTGGARSGKSSAAQRLAESRADLGFPVRIAVFGRPSDAEMEVRIARHQAARPESFDTLEVSEPDGWMDCVDDEDLLVIDCLGTLLGLLMERSWRDCACETLGDAAAGDLPEGVGQALVESFDLIVARLCNRLGDTIVVTNEVGLGLVPEWASGRIFRDLLGQANRALVNASDAAYLIVAGRAIDLKSSSAIVRWPED